MRDDRGRTRRSKGRATPWRAKSALQNYYNSKPFSYFGPSEPTLDLRLLQPPDLHHFLGRSQKFVAPHSEHAYFGTSAPSPKSLGHFAAGQLAVFKATTKQDVKHIDSDMRPPHALPASHFKRNHMPATYETMH